jgi:hypothetical protein
MKKETTIARDAERFAEEIVASLKQPAEDFVSRWVALSTTVLEWEDNRVQQSPGEHLQMLASCIHAGKAASLLSQPFQVRPDGKRISNIQRDLKRKYTDWVFRAAQVGFRTPR